MSANTDKRRSGYFYIPDLSWFTEGNPYIVSENTFNFILKPSDEGLTATVWYGMKCFELSEPVCDKTAGKDDDGLTELAEFVDREFEAYRGKVESGEVQGRRTYKPAGHIAGAASAAE